MSFTIINGFKGDLKGMAKIFYKGQGSGNHFFHKMLTISVPERVILTIIIIESYFNKLREVALKKMEVYF